MRDIQVFYESGIRFPVKRDIVLIREIWHVSRQYTGRMDFWAYQSLKLLF
jgi:hypothetical protein